MTDKEYALDEANIGVDRRYGISVTSYDWGMEYEGFVELPINVLKDYGTACGKEGNRFSKEIINYLRDCGVTHVYAVFMWQSNDHIGGDREIMECLIKMPFEKAEVFSDMVDKNDGSLRPEEHGDGPDGLPWCWFESE